MIKLSKELYDKVWALVEKSQGDYANDDFESAIVHLEQAWELLPEPKEESDESFLVTRWFIKTAIKFSSEELMRKWGPMILKVDLERFDSGEREGWYGRIAYELGDYDTAKQYLTLALKKSRGRCFTSNDKKYLDFIKK